MAACNSTSNATRPAETASRPDHNEVAAVRDRYLARASRLAGGEAVHVGLQSRAKVEDAAQRLRFLGALISARSHRSLAGAQSPALRPVRSGRLRTGRRPSASLRVARRALS